MSTEELTPEEKSIQLSLRCMEAYMEAKSKREGLEVEIASLKGERGRIDDDPKRAREFDQQIAGKLEELSTFITYEYEPARVAWQENPTRKRARPMDRPEQ